MAPRALIAGAGIGGLTAALALSRAGFEAIVFERAKALAEYGAGLQLSPNATRILARIGALDAVRPLAAAPEAIRLLRGRDDSEIAALPLTGAEARWKSPYLVIHRADLQAALVQAAQARESLALRLGAEVDGVSQSRDSVSFSLPRGSTETGEVAIGADGVRSRVRESIGLGGAASLAFSGRVAFRATLPARALPPEWSRPVVTLRLAPRAHLVAYPLRGGSIVNLVAVIESGWREDGRPDLWDGEADRPALERAFAAWRPETRRLVSEAPEWRAWPLFHRPPILSYSVGRVALLGDAAHPMVPFLAQGAGQAIEDASALAAALEGAPDSAAALAAYSRVRAPRAGRVQREALAQARVYHMAGPMAFARDLAMRALGPDRLLSRYDWLYAA